MPQPTTNHPVPTSNIQDGVLTLSVDHQLYPLDTLFSASYVFLNRAYILFGGSPRATITITFEPKVTMDDDALRGLCGDFMNELVAVRVRQTIADRNKTIREYIVSSVLAGAVGDPGAMDFGGGLDTDVDLEALGVPLDEVPESDLQGTPTQI